MPFIYNPNRNPLRPSDAPPVTHPGAGETLSTWPFYLVFVLITVGEGIFSALDWSIWAHVGLGLIYVIPLWFYLLVALNYRSLYLLKFHVITAPCAWAAYFLPAWLTLQAANQADGLPTAGSLAVTAGWFVAGYIGCGWGFWVLCSDVRQKRLQMERETMDDEDDENDSHWR